MKQHTIALICDCDSTLAPDTTHFLLQQNKIDIGSFWKEIEKIVQDGWDPPLAWMTKILLLMKNNSIKQDTNKKLEELGKEIKTYPGVSQFIQEIRDQISKNTEFVKAGIKLKCFIVSQGIEDLISGSSAFSDFEVFGARFGEDLNTGKINSIKSVVTFTEKTKFLFAINKGISSSELRASPYLVNTFIPPDERKVPFQHMIYLGDSPNDIPCFSMIQRMGGVAVGVSGDKTFRRGFELAKGNRTTVGPYTADYRDGSDLRKTLDSAINKLGYDIITKEKLAGRL